MPGSVPATSQLDWLSSTTAMIVLFWSRATRDLLKSFGWGIAALHRLMQRRSCYPRRPPHSVYRYRSCERVSRLLPNGDAGLISWMVLKHRSSRETTMVGRGPPRHGRLFDGGTDGSNPVPSSSESILDFDGTLRKESGSPTSFRGFVGV